VIKSLFQIAFITACSNTAIRGDFTPEQVREDLMELKENLVKYHPGLYRYTPKDSIDYYFDNAAYTDHPIDSVQLYARITSVLSKVRCGHTRSRMSEQMRLSLEDNQVFIPLSVKILDGRYYVNKSLDDNLKAGDEILTINGQTISEIQNEIFDHLPSDGWIRTGKERWTEFMFDIYLQLYVTNNEKEFELQTRRDSETKKIRVEGKPFTDVNSIRNTDPNHELLSASFFQNYAYMRIGSFGEGYLNESGYDFEEFLEESFEELSDKGTQNLILDLRGNGGGNDNYGALLVSYLAPDSFDYFDRIEVTKDYPGNSTIIDGQYRYPNHRGLSTWEPQPSVFKGNLYVLIDGRSFSTCADVATVLHFHKWATFIGEETGGGYDGNTSGHSMSLELPNSGAIISIPMWMYTTANKGHLFRGQGVIPDYRVSWGWEDYEANRDVALEKAIELIEKVDPKG